MGLRECRGTAEDSLRDRSEQYRANHEFQREKQDRKSSHHHAQGVRGSREENCKELVMELPEMHRSSKDGSHTQRSLLMLIRSMS